MKTTHLTEITINYKPRRKKAVVTKITSSMDADKYLRSIWNDQIGYREVMYLILLSHWS